MSKQHLHDFLERIVGGRAPEQAVLDSIPFPPSKLREMLVLADEYEGHQSALNHYKLWQFVTEAVPAVQGKECHLKSVTAGSYHIEIVGDSLGKEALLFWHPIPSDRLYWFLEMLDKESKVDRYDLFQYLVSIEPRLNDPEVESVMRSAYGHVGFGGKKK